jgi:HlyD family secretion protein
MSDEETAATSMGPITTPAPRRGDGAGAKGRKRPWRWLALTAVAVAGSWWIYTTRPHDKAAPGASSGTRDHEAARGADRPSVRVVHPRQGGLARTTQMPGTIRAFEYAPLQAKVSGYLKTLHVDRGDRVKKGQVLMTLYVPELDGALIGAQAAMKQAQAVEIQSEARVRTAEVGVKAAEARRLQAGSVLEAATANRNYRKQARDRITELAGRNAVEQKLVDEEEARYLAAISEVHSANAGIATADVQIAEAKAAVDQAKADLGVARAQVAVAAANVEKAKIMVDYTTIESPFDGVVIFRGDGVHPGAFVREVVDRTNSPLLTIARVDIMRTIIEVPDRDVPFCNPGDPVSLKVDALGGRVFQAKVSRISDSEDLSNRTMRVEVDLPNPDGIFRDGMYGQAVISLETPSALLTVPATCLVDQDGSGEATVLAVRNGVVKRVPIQIGRDNGLLVEVNGGLTVSDAIVLQPTPALNDGSLVNVQDATTAANATSNDRSHAAVEAKPNPHRDAGGSEPT